MGEGREDVQKRQVICRWAGGGEERGKGGREGREERRGVERGKGFKKITPKLFL